jgi:ribosomal protein L5
MFNRNIYFSEKFILKNFFQLPRLKNISLYFLKDNSKDILISSAALFLITSKQPTVLYNTLSKKRKNKKEYIGCKVCLQKKDAITFLYYLILIILPQIPSIGNIIKSNKSSFSNLLVFGIDDLMIFPEINKEVSKFYGLKGLKISLNFDTSFKLSYLLNLINLKALK